MPATYEPISTTTVSGSAVTTISLTSIPATYTDLRLVLYVRTNAGGDLTLRFNGDTATNYSATTLNGNGTAGSSTRNTSQTSIILSPTLGAAGNFRYYSIDIMSYAGSTNKTALIEGNGNDNAAGNVSRQVALWRNTAAITSISVVSTTANAINTLTMATLYGIKAA